MRVRKTKFKRGDVLYCYKTYDCCECIVRILFKKADQGNPGYHVQAVSSNACTTIHDDCCAKDAVKVSQTFVDYLRLFTRILPSGSK